MDRKAKEALVKQLNSELKKSEVVVVAHYSGLNVAQMSELRNSVKQAGGVMKVVKNRLSKLALPGSSKESIGDYLTGPTVLAFSSDPVAAPKAFSDFAKKNDKLVILGGAMNGVALDENGVKQLATMPSIDELRGKIVGLIQAPATKVAGVLQAPAGQLARVISAKSKVEA